MNAERSNGCFSFKSEGVNELLTGKLMMVSCHTHGLFMKILPLLEASKGFLYQDAGEIITYAKGCGGRLKYNGVKRGLLHLRRAGILRRNGQGFDYCPALIAESIGMNGNQTKGRT